jgi:hypothetical protein
MPARSFLVLLAALALAACTSTQGRNIGRAVGVASAVLGGPQSEPIDDAIERYRTARDAGAAIGELSEATKFALALQQLEGVDVNFGDDGQIDLYLVDPERAVASVANVLANGPRPLDQLIEVEGPADTAFAFRDGLIEHGLAGAAIEAYRADDLDGVALHIRYRS